jgi:hypothetical protein
MSRLGGSTSQVRNPLSRTRPECAALGCSRPRGRRRLPLQHLRRWSGPAGWWHRRDDVYACDTPHDQGQSTGGADVRVPFWHSPSCARMAQGHTAHTVVSCIPPRLETSHEQACAQASFPQGQRRQPRSPSQRLSADHDPRKGLDTMVSSPFLVRPGAGLSRDRRNARP